MSDYTDSQLHAEHMADSGRLDTDEAAAAANQAVDAGQAAAITATQATDASQGSAITTLQTTVANHESRIAHLEGAPPPPPPPPPAPQPSGSFTLDKTSGNAPLTVQSTVGGTNVDTYQVTWDDGQVGIVHALADPAPQHVYQAVGTYHPQVLLMSAAYPAGVVVNGPAVTVAAAPAPVGTLGQQFGGLSAPLGQSPTFTDIDAIAAAGFGFYRHDLPVVDISPSKGTWNWGNYDSWISHVVAKGMKYLPIVYILPQWMNGSTNDKTHPTNPQDYADWCGQAAMHLWTLGVRHMELWNEPNIGFWQPAADRKAYTQMAKLAAKAIHIATPGMTVVSGGVSTSDDQTAQSGDGYTSPWPGCHRTLDFYGYYGLFYDADGLSQVDAVGIHPYLDATDPSPTGGSNWCEWAGGALRTTISIVDKWANGRRLPIWNTESAYPAWSGISPGTEAEKANRAAHAFQAFNTWTLADGVTKMRTRLGPYFWFTYHDWSDAGEVRARYFGLVDPSYNAHPALGAVTPILKGPLAP